MQLLPTRTLLSALLAVAYGTLLPAQQTTPTTPPVKVALAPPTLLTLFDAMAGTVQQLQVPNGNAGAAIIDVVLAGVPERLELHSFDVRAPAFQLWERGPTGLVLLPTPPCVTYRGAVQGEVGSEVAATLVGGSLTAFVRRGTGELWLVQPVREVVPTAGITAHIVFRGVDSANINAHCGVPGALQGVVPVVGNEDAVYVCQLAIEADNPLYVLNGSNITNTQNDVTGIVNAMDVIYRRDVQVALTVSQLIVNSAADPYTSSVATTLLPQFGNYWNANHAGITRDTAHLFSGRQIGANSGGTIGLAYVGVVCLTNNAYGLSQTRFSANYGYRVGVTAHELGHNFNANHCDSSPPCNIMCSGLGGCANNQSLFSANEAAQIIAFRQSLGCLTLQLTVPQITSASPLQVATVNPPLVTLGGTGFIGTTSLTVGGTLVNTGITVVSDTQLRFTPPVGLNLGIQSVSATNTAGTSTNYVLIYTNANPAQLVVPAFVIGGTTMTWRMGGVQNDTGYLGIGFVNTTSPFQGQPLLDGFTLLWAGPLDARGMASLPVPVPAGLFNGWTIYSQMLDEIAGTGLLRSLSPVKTTQFFF